jgi:hypothetical protein
LTGVLPFSLFFAIGQVPFFFVPFPVRYRVSTPSTGKTPRATVGDQGLPNLLHVLGGDNSDPAQTRRFRKQVPL